MEGVKLQEYYGTMHEGGGSVQNCAFYIPFGSPALGRASRGATLGGLLAVKDKVFHLLRAIRRFVS
jgi:hypothetical protein